MFGVYFMNVATILIVLFLAILVGLGISFPTILKLIRLRRTPTTWISALPPTGPVEITGQVGEKTILTPIGKTSCAAYKYEIQEFKKSNNGARWSTVRKFQSDEPFELSDGTGSIQVRPAGADFMVSMDSQTDVLNAEQIAAIQNLGVKTIGFFGSAKKLKLNEYVVRPGQEIYVAGHIQQVDGIKSIAGAGGVRLVISDGGERSIMRTLYIQIGKIVLICLAVGIAIIVILLQNL